MTRNLLTALLLFGLLSCGGAERKTQPGMCAKEEMAADGIVRLSKIEVWPQFVDEYIKYVTEVGEREPGGIRQAHRFRTFSEIQARDAAHGQVVETNRPDTTQSRQPNQQLYKIIYSTHEKDTVFIIRSNND